jgi:hypothetical protein
MLAIDGGSSDDVDCSTAIDARWKARCADVCNGRSVDETLMCVESLSCGSWQSVNNQRGELFVAARACVCCLGGDALRVSVQSVCCLMACFNIRNRNLLCAIDDQKVSGSKHLDETRD